MRVIYEKIIKDDENNNIFIECNESEAEFIHYCYNEDKKKKPCKRVPLH